jgi:hypothetical protein
MGSRIVPLAFTAFALPGLGVLSVQGSFVSCTRQEPATIVETPNQVAAHVAAEAAKPLEPPTPVHTPEKAPEKAAEKSPRERLQEWLSARLPKGGAIVEDGPTLVVEHTAGPESQKGVAVRTLAAQYVDLTTAYSEAELVSAILHENPGLGLGAIKEGKKVRIPKIVAEVPEPAAESRLGWPKEDGGALRGIYVSATMAGQAGFPKMLDELAARGMNAIVLDAKDVTGFFTYPSKIPLALETDANKHATVSSFERVVRYAHARGIRVIARVTCFRDEWIGPRKPELAIRAKGGGAHVGPSKRVDWLDPSSETVQGYILSIVEEVLGAGVDEVQLDYVRYPTEGIGGADFKLAEKGLSTSDVITGFVEKVHAKTSAASVPLSLDVFGVVSWRYQKDIDATGQDVRRLAHHIEALSPMVYPSHFADGFHGFEKPGDHPEIVGIGTKRALEEIAAAGKTVGPQVVVRSWVQAFPWHTTSFGSKYVADQIASAKQAGGTGWLAWNSGGEYGATFAAVPKKPVVVAKK